MNQISTAGNRGEGVRSDCHVTFELKQRGGIRIVLESRVERIFGDQIREQVAMVLDHLEIAHAVVHLEDTGALPFVIGARLEAAVKKLRPSTRAWLPPLEPRNRYETERGGSRISRLYIPGNMPRMMLNAGIHRPDGIILDLEDSVTSQKKDEARILVRNALRQVDFCGCERMVRINQLPAGLEDLEQVVPQPVHLLLIPKCEHGSQVNQVEEKVKEILGEEAGQRQLFLMPIIESCLGIEHAFEIASASDRVVAMAIGLEDLTADMGVKRSDGGEESRFARSRLVNACKAAGIQPIDSVFSDVDDMDGLLDHVRISKSLGFEGMGCIHPRQVPVIHSGFAPDEEEISRAERIVAAFREAEEQGLGVVSLGSKMIDPPVVKRAQHTLSLAQRFGLRNKPSAL